MVDTKASPSGSVPQVSQREKDVRTLAEYIKSDKCKKIVLMLGAGVSTSAGIPDFRSPGTGLYSNLARLNLPHPEAVFELGFFRNNPIPFYTLAAELYPGAFRPTPTHSFINLLSDHGLLHMCFTQNIDTLERRAGVPENKIVEAHGSFATQRCIKCQTPFDDEEMREIVLGPKKPGEPIRIPKCKRKGCGGLVKPDIVFFGESLPSRFIEQVPTIGLADLLIIIGTSLTVHPFASLAEMSDRRVLINLERVGSLGRRRSDVVLLGECDAIVRELCTALGWEEELDAAWAKTALKGSNENSKAADEEKEASLEQELQKITDAIEKQMDLSKGQSKEDTSTERPPRDENASSAGSKSSQVPDNKSISGKK